MFGLIKLLEGLNGITYCRTLGPKRHGFKSSGMQMKFIWPFANELDLRVPIACHVGSDIAFQNIYFLREIYIEIDEHVIHRRCMEFE
jgi:hypothetical protein